MLHDLNIRLNKSSSTNKANNAHLTVHKNDSNNISSGVSNLKFIIPKKHQHCTPHTPTNSVILSELKEFMDIAVPEKQVYPFKESIFQISQNTTITSDAPFPQHQHKPKHSSNINPQQACTTFYPSFLMNNNPPHEQSSPLVQQLRTQIDNIPNYSELKTEKEKTINTLKLSINTLINKINHLQKETEKNLSDNYNINNDNMKIVFHQETIRHKQNHFNNEIPVLKDEITHLKITINQLKEKNDLLNLQIFKFQTDVTMLNEDSKKMNSVIEMIAAENSKLAYDLVVLQNKKSEMKLKVQEISRQNRKIINNVNSLISIKQQ